MLADTFDNTNGWPDPKEFPILKVFGNETAKNVCDEAIQIMGCTGFLKDLGVERVATGMYAVTRPLEALWTFIET